MTGVARLIGVDERELVSVRVWRPVAGVERERVDKDMPADGVAEESPFWSRHETKRRW